MRVITDLEHHVQEVFGVGERVIWEHEGQTSAESVTHRRKGGHLGH